MSRHPQASPEQPDSEKATQDPSTAFDPATVESELRSMTRIVLRPIGSPLPLGFFTVAIDSVLVSTLQWGILPASYRQAVALIIFSAFIVQLIVAIFAFLARDSIAGTLMLSFATTWLVDSLILYRDPRGSAEAIGIFFIVFSVFVTLMLVVALPKRALAAVIAVAAPRYFVAGIAEITGVAGISKAAATLGFLLAAVSLYTAFALLLEDVRGTQVLPIGRSGAADYAVHGSLAQQLRNIERQAGVRRTL